MNPPIRIYIHSYMVHHHLEIMENIFSVMEGCGLYEECERIYIGCLGEESELKRLQDFLLKYPKAEIAAYSNNPLEFEFFTLKILKKHCDEAKEKFYPMYLMTKGVSYGKEHEMYQGGKFWLDYMLDWIVSRYRNNYKALNLKFRGYDIVGVKIIPARESPSNRTHASGSFFFANSEYIKSLRKIETLNTKDRWEAEMWSFSGQPIIYMPCNLFIDYLVKGDYFEFIKSYKELPEFCL